MKDDEKATGYLWPEMVGKSIQEDAAPVPEKYTAEFEAFWNAYPIKQDKRHAFKAFKTALKRAKLTDIMAGVARYKAALAADPKRPVKYAQGWLNGDRWLDEHKSQFTDDYAWRAHQRSRIGVSKYQ